MIREDDLKILDEGYGGKGFYMSRCDTSNNTLCTAVKANPILSHLFYAEMKQFIRAVLNMKVDARSRE